jgi:hypothetical protein
MRARVTGEPGPTGGVTFRAPDECRERLARPARRFALLVDKQIKRGVHRSVQQLKVDITGFIRTHNADPKPFVCAKSADTILQRMDATVKPVLYAQDKRLIFSP